MSNYWIVESIGLVATSLLIISMCFNTKSYKGTLLMRILNLSCSFVWIVYALLKSPILISTLISNTLLVFINLYFLIIAVKNKEKFSRN